MRATETLVIEQLPIGDLKPDPANPRRISDQEMESLTRSLREFGFVQPVVARREDLVVIGGHQRLLAARRLGWKQVPVIFLDLSQEQARVLNLALNKISGAWDNELLGRLLSELKEIPDVDLSLTGFGDDELKKYLKGLEAWEKKEKLETFDLEEALKAARAAPVAHTGDLWRLGDHRLLCGDSLDPAQVERLMAGARASMAFTDPPYNVDYGNHGGAPRTGRRRAIQNDDLGQGFHEFLIQACGNLLSVTDGAVYVCMSSSELHNLQRAFVEAGGHWSTFIIWAKDNFILGRSDYQRQYEPLLYGWREGTKHHWCGARDQGDVWQFDKPSASPLHPTMKPVPLVQRAIENSSQTGDVVLDLFLGSGSTLIGCERTGRVCYGMELEPEYVDVARMRWEAFTGEKASKEEQ
jgi:DNA modification methylase